MSDGWRRRIAVSAVMVAIAAAGMVVSCARQAAPPVKRNVTLEQAQRVQVGMTRDEVYKELGLPHEAGTEGMGGVEVWFENMRGGNDQITGIIVDLEGGRVKEKPTLTGAWAGK